MKQLPRESQDSVLLAVGELIGREIALEALVHMLVDRLVSALGAERGTLYFVDAARHQLFSKAGHLPELKEIRLKLGQGIAGQVALTGELMNVSSTSSERRFFDEIDRQTGFHSRSVLAAPLRDRRGRVFGVIQLLNKKLGAFSVEDEQTLASLAKQAARALEATSLYQELRRVEADPSPVSYVFNRVVGESEAMRAVYRATAKAAASTASVLIRGESGTGKELIARAIQVNGARRDKPFIKVDCAALPEGLIENELFGHERGAFTGATHRVAGKFEVADGGTVFVDEVGELPLHVQGKLLRVLQDRAFERVGGTETVSADVRILAATHRDLERMVEEGRFRADLYYRIRVVELMLPPLRERGADDIRRLAHHFVAAAAQKHGRELPVLDEAALRRLEQHAWPGNVRELEHCIESAVVMAEHGRITAETLPLPSRPVQPGAGHLRDAGALDRPPEPTGRIPGAGRSEQACPLTLAELERQHIQATLLACAGNRTVAARALGIGRNTLVRKLKAYQIDGWE